MLHTSPPLQRQAKQDYLYSVGYVTACYVCMYAKHNNNYRIGHAFKRGLLGEDTEWGGKEEEGMKMT